MAVDPELVAKDMYLADVGDLDERIVRDGWTYYVQAVKRPLRLGRASVSSGSLIGDLLIVLPLELFLEWRARGRPWTLGVVRLGYVGGWNDPRPRVVHRETYAGPHPAVRIAELTADVAAGRFHPAPS